MFSNKLNLLFVLLLIFFTCSNAKSLSKLGAFKSQAETCTKGMGINGICPNLLDVSKTVLPSSAQSIFNSYLKPILSSYSKNMQICLGDFSLTELGSNDKLSIGGCNSFP